MTHKNGSLTDDEMAQLSPRATKVRPTAEPFIFEWADDDLNPLFFDVFIPDDLTVRAEMQANWPQSGHEYLAQAQS